MADPQAVEAFLEGDTPAPHSSPALAGLWWAHRGAWERAHAFVQDADGPDAAWVHAHLHRLEGDIANASYWYRRAGRPMPSDDPARERVTIVATLLMPT